MKFCASVLFAALLSTHAMAGECVLTIERKACPGKEEVAYKPYAGKTTTEEKKSSDSEADCKKQAEKAARIVRKGTLSAKQVTAKFDGKPAGDASDKADCQ